MSKSNMSRLESALWKAQFDSLNMVVQVEIHGKLFQARRLWSAELNHEYTADPATKLPLINDENGAVNLLRLQAVINYCDHVTDYDQFIFYQIAIAQGDIEKVDIDQVRNELAAWEWAIYDMLGDNPLSVSTEEFTDHELSEIDLWAKEDLDIKKSALLDLMVDRKALYPWETILDDSQVLQAGREAYAQQVANSSKIEEYRDSVEQAYLLQYNGKTFHKPSVLKPVKVSIKRFLNAFGEWLES
jgi:hypothetical protein